MATTIRVALALGSSVVAIMAARADEFSWELAGLYGESERGEFFDSQHSALGGAYYFGPVDDASGPYALAAFFDPESRVSVAASRSEDSLEGTLSFGGPGTPIPFTSSAFSIESESTDYSVGGRYVLPKSKWYAGGRYARGELEAPDSDVETYGVLAGKYLGRATTLELALTSSRNDSESEVLGCLFPLLCPTGTISSEATTETASLAVLHVRRFRSLTYSLSGAVGETRVSVATDVQISGWPPGVTPLPPVFVVGVVAVPMDFEYEAEPTRTYSVGGELFPTAKLGVRLGYTWFGDDSYDQETYELATTWFFRRNVGLEFGFSQQRLDSPGAPDTDGATLRVIGRF